MNLVTITLALTILSVADSSGVGWLLARALAFIVVVAYSYTRAHQLAGVLAVAFSIIAATGLRGLDYALVCLAFVLFRNSLKEFGHLCAFVGLMGSASFIWTFWWPVSVPLFPFHNRNHYSVFCELSLPVLVYCWQRYRNPLLPCAAAAMIVTSLAAGSRVGAVLILVEICLLCTVVAGRKKLWMAATAAGFGASLFLLFAEGSRVSHPFEGDHRIEIWAAGLDMIAARPWVGWGVGEFSRIYPGFARFDNGQVVNAAHSDWLEWMIEFGILPGLIWIGIFLHWARKRVHFYPSWGILIGALHAVVDYPFHLPGLLVFGAALAGSIKAYGTGTKAKPANC